MSDGLSSIFPPSSIDEVLGRLASLSNEAFEELRAQIRKDGFEDSGERCKLLGSQIDLSAESVAIILSALSFVYSRLSKLPKDNNAKLIEDLVAGFEIDEDAKNILVARLPDLVAPSAEIDFARKLARLRAGFIDNATGFSSFLDLRPIYEEENRGICGFIPIIQFRIATDAENSSDREYIFQLDESGLSALKTTILSAETKLNTLRDSNLLAAPLYERKWNRDV